MSKKKTKGKGKGKAITVKATPTEFRESGFACAQLALWACEAFSLPQTAENASMMYRLAWSRADDHMQMERFALDPMKG